MQKIITNKGVIGIFVLILSVLILFLYTKIDSFSIASTSGEVITEINLNKYINYNEEWGKGTLLQYSIKTGVNYNEDVQSTVKNATVTVGSPQINGTYPERIAVTNKSTKSIGNYSYDKNTGIITIFVSNEDEEGNPIDNSAIDEFEIISNYGQAAYNDEEAERDLTIQISAKYNLFAQENNVVEEYKEFKAVASKNIGNVLSVSQKVDEVYNGYIKSNIINGTDYSTIYKEYDEIEIGNKNAQENIEINESTEDAIYRSTTVRAEDVINVLGEDGSIEISDIDGNLVGTLNKDNVTLIYENSLSDINIKTSSVINEGIIRIENTKEVKDKTKLIDNIKTIRQIAGEIYEDIVEIKNSETKVDVAISNSEWTNQRQNEITFDITLNSNNVKYNLVKNPTIQISLPSDVEKVILEESALLYGNGLELQNVAVEENENGKFIIATLQGSQAEYIENELGLTTTLKIPAIIILKQEIETREEKINISYKNEYKIEGTIETGNIEKEIKIVNYREEAKKIQELEQEIKLNTLMENSVRAESATEIDENSLILEVVPTRGETVLNEGDIVYEGEFIKYNIRVTNNTDADIDNVKIVTTIPEGVTYGELVANYYEENGTYEYNFDDTIRNKEYEVGTIKAGKSWTNYYEVRANDLLDEETEKQIENNIKAYIQEQEVRNYSITNYIKQAEAKTILRASLNGASDNWCYRVDIDSNETADLTLKVPEQFKFEYFSKLEKIGDVIGGDKWSEGYDVNNNIITAKLPSGTYEIGGLIDRSLFKELETENYEIELFAYATIKVGNTTYNSNENRIKVKYENVSIVMKSEKEGEEVEYNEEINYEITISNNGGTNLLEPYSGVSINLKDYLPEHFEPTNVTYENWELNEEENRFEKVEKTEEILNYKNSIGEFVPVVDLYLTIPYEESSKINVKGVAGMVYEKTKVQNNATVSENTFSEDLGESSLEAKTSNTITYYIKPYYNMEENEEEYEDNYLYSSDDIDNNDQNNPNNQNEQNDQNDENSGTDSNNLNEENNYSISGTVWVDNNNNGKKDADESTLNDITVMLVNMENSSGVYKKTTTSENGIYEFTDLSIGNYVVVFKYDTEKYGLTSYKKSGVSSSENSDAQSSTIIINGEQVLAGITDILNLTNNIYNLDVGLLNKQNAKFNINKTVTKVTVETNKGTKEKKYNNSNLVKTEIKAKEIEGAKVTAQYKITVTNEGEYSAKIEELVDNIPEGFTFDESANNGWTNKNGKQIINTSMADKEIQVGESIEIPITLTKTMTAEETGTYINTVQISGQENSSSANLIISISTGSRIIFISIIIALIGLVIFICYAKKIGINLIKRKSLLVFILTIIMCINTSSIVDAYSEAPNSARFVYAWKELGANCHYFWGIETSDAYCLQHSIYASPNGGANTDPIRRSFSKIINGTTITETISEDDISITLTKQASQIQMNKVDNYYIYGPFRFKCIGESNYSVSATDCFGNIVSGATICNENGNNLTLSGEYTSTKEFYVKISAANTEKGVQNIKLTANREGVRRLRKRKVGYARYNHRRWQDVKTKDIYQRTESSNNNTQAISNEKYITWDIPTGNIIIIKQDADDSRIKLKGVEIQITCDELNYDKTFTTDNNGKILIEGLIANKKYTLKEKTNNNYGYKHSTNSRGITINPGMQRTFVIANVKKTGNLEIEKIDDNTETPIGGIGFKLKNSAGKFIKAQTVDNNFRGNVYITNIETTDSIEEASQFITNNNGYLKIYNLLMGTYTIIETSTGNNDKYIIEDDCIKWQKSDGTIVQGTSTSVNINRLKSYDTVKNTSIIKDNKKTIEDGTYEIQTMYTNTKDDTTLPMVLDVKNGKPYDGTNIQSYYRNNSASQTFYVQYLGNDVYTIRNLGTNKMVDLNGGYAKKTSSSDGANIQIWHNNNSDAQKWEIIKENATNNYYTIKSNVDNSKMDTSISRKWVIDVKGASNDAGNNIQIWNYNNTKAQRFKFYDKTGYNSETATATKLIVRNKRKYIKISGNVWEEKSTGKDNSANHLMDDDEIKLQNIKVLLKDNSGKEIETTTTKENGYYSFDKVEIDKLGQYHIEFEYDGEIYTTVKSYNELPENKTKYTQINAPANTSKALEVSSQRQTLDKSYKNITDKGEMNISSTDATSQSNVNGDSGDFTVNYSSNVSNGGVANTKEINIGKLKRDLSEQEKTRNVNQFNDYENYNINKVIASTAEAGYSLTGGQTIDNIRKNLDEISNINCGLVQREKPNISIYTDLVKVTATVNGYTHDYYYDTLKHAIDQSNGEEAKETFKLDIYNGNKNYIRKVYASDIKSGCEIYLTYRITVKNHSNTLNTKVYKISNYYDARYERVGAGTTEEANNENSTIIVADDEEYSKSTGYKKSYITYEDTPLIEANGGKSEIYIKYKLNNNAVISIMSGDPTRYNIVEVQEYSTHYGEKTYYHNRNMIKHDIYAGIDRNSAPGNAIIENEEGKPSTLTFEDDTMMAPSITISLTTNERTISGNVFEDVQTEESKNNKERLGDGKYTVEDRKVGKVKVELYKYVHPDPDNLKGQEAIWNPSLEEDVAKVWIKQEDGTYEEENAIVWTNENGEYSISGILPGEYVLKYTYGNGTVIYGKQNGTNANTTLTSANKYKSTIITSQNIKNALERNPENAMWYKTTKEGNEIKPAEENEARYSVAVDGSESYNKDGDGNEVAIKNSNQYTLGNDLKEKSAFTAPMNFKFEMVDNDNDGKADIADPTIKRTVTKYNEDGSAQVETVLDYKVNNIDFGIVEKPFKKYDIEKIIKNVKLSIANGPNGQVIIEGNPADTANPLNYVKYLENSPFNRANTVNMEIDNELLVGATLEITYEVKAINKSEVDYHTYGYYYYGTDKTNPITIKFSKVIDYLDNDLLLDSYSINNHIKIAKVGDEKIEIKDSDLITADYLASDIIENAKKYQNVLILESDTKTSPIDSIEAQKEVKWQYKVSRLLTAANEKLDFSNYVEAIEIETIGVGSYDNILGNFDPVPDQISKVDTEYPGETDYYGENISITNPTGGNRNIWIGVTAIFALVILASGIVIIKKKVL